MIAEKYCNKCKKIHVIVTTANEEELFSLKVATTRINIAENFLRDSSSSTQVILAALLLQANARVLVDRWWKEISDIYSLKTLKMSIQSFQVEFTTGEIYYLKDTGTS